MDIINLVENKNDSEFYPTPENLVSRMIDKINWKGVKTILEPSAGKGDLLKGVARKENKLSRMFDVDAIELDSNLRSILRYNFSKEAKDIILKKRAVFTERYGRSLSSHPSAEGTYDYFDSKDKEYHPLPESEQEQLASIDREKEGFFREGIHIVHDDFLSYAAYKLYDVIIMNPPFSCGDRHLLKALEMQKNGGQIVCLLNAETIKNPCTPTRVHLVKLLNNLDTDIEYIEYAFEEGERPTSVETALIYVNIPYTDKDGIDSIYDRMEKARVYDEPEYDEGAELSLTDYIKSAVNRYCLEVEAGIELIRTFNRVNLPTTEVAGLRKQFFGAGKAGQ